MVTKKFSEIWDERDKDKQIKLDVLDLLITILLEHDKRMSELIEELEIFISNLELTKGD